MVRAGILNLFLLIALGMSAVLTTSVRGADRVPPPEHVDPQTLQKRIESLEKRLQAVEARLSTSSPQPAASVAAASADPPPIAVTALSKRFEPADVLTDQANDRIVIELRFQSKAKQPIRALAAVAIFRDLFGREILRADLTDEEGVKPGARVDWDGWVPYQEFDPGCRRLQSIAADDLEVALESVRIVFGDGTRASYAMPPDGSAPAPSLVKLQKLAAPEAVGEDDGRKPDAAGNPEN